MQTCNIYIYRYIYKDIVLFPYSPRLHVDISDMIRVFSFHLLARIIRIFSFLSWYCVSFVVLPLSKFPSLPYPCYIYIMLMKHVLYIYIKIKITVMATISIVDNT